MKEEEKMMSEKGIFEFNFAIENITQKEADKIGDAFIKAVEKYKGRAIKLMIKEKLKGEMKL